MISENTRKQNEKILKKFFSKQVNENLAESTKDRYIQSVNLWSDFNKKPLKDLLENAKIEQLSYMDDHNRIIEPDINNSELSEQLDGFVASEYEHGKAKSTIDIDVGYIKTFYSKMGVKQFPYYKKSKVKSSNKPLDKTRIKRGIELSNFKLGTVYEFLVSTGFRISDMIVLTVENWMDSVGIKSIKELLTFDEEDMPIGYWELVPIKTKNSSGVVCKVGCAKTANRRILRMLKQRHLKKPLALNQPLFENNKMGFYTNVGMSASARTVNQKLHEQDVSYYKKLLEDNEISEDKYYKKIDEIPKFHCHGFRHYFCSILRNKGVPLGIAACMEGHKPPLATDEIYVEIQKEDVLREYAKIEKYLSMSDETQTDLKKKVERLQRQLSKNKEDLQELNAKISTD